MEKRNIEALTRRWEDLPIDILRKIFNYVPLSDLSTNVSSVCRSWQLSCWYFLCWSNKWIDFRVIKHVLSNEIELSEENYDRFSVRLMVLLKSILDDNQRYGIYLKRWRWSIRAILIPDIEISDEQLFYIAERTIRLKKLIIGSSSRITGGRGFVKALSKWKNLEWIFLGGFEYQYFQQVIEEIGRHYSNYSSLKVLTLSLPDFHLGHNEAGVIVKNLVGVKMLMFVNVFIHRDGIKMILENFDKVYITCCFLSDEDEGAEKKNSLCSYPFYLNFTSKRKEGFLDGASESLESINKSIWEVWINRED